MSYDQGIGNISRGRLINLSTSRIYVNNNLGRNGLLGYVIKMGSGNVLGAYFWQIHMGRKVTGFGGKFTNIRKEIICG